MLFLALSNTRRRKVGFGATGAPAAEVQEQATFDPRGAKIVEQLGRMDPFEYGCRLQLAHHASVDHY